MEISESASGVPDTASKLEAEAKVVSKFWANRMLEEEETMSEQKDIKDSAIPIKITKKSGRLKKQQNS